MRIPARAGDAVADRHLRHALADRLHDPDTFVPGRERQLRLDRPVAVRRVDVGVAET